MSTLANWATRNALEAEVPTSGATAILPFINLTSYNVKFDGITDDTLAWRDAIAALPLGGTILAPPGTSLITDTVTVNFSRIRIIGAGEQASKIKFVPTSGKPCFLFDNGGGLGHTIAQNAFIGFGFSSTDVTFQKIMVKFIDAEEIEIAHIASAGNWSGANSIGIQSMGRQTANIHDHIISADICIDLQQNPRAPGLDTDHYHFWNLNLISNDSAAAHPIINVAAAVVLSNLTFDGYQAWNLGGHGFYYPGNAASSGFNIAIHNVRWEQSTNATGYFIYLGLVAQGLRNVLFTNLYGGQLNRGIYLRRTAYTTMHNVHYIGTGVALDMDSTCAETSWFDCYWGAGASATIAGQSLVWGSNISVESTVPLRPSAIYTQSSNAANLTYVNGLTVKDGANQRMGTATLDGASPPRVTVNNTSITANTRIFTSKVGSTSGAVLEISRVAGTSFTLGGSTNGDTSVINWLLIEPG